MTTTQAELAQALYQIVLVLEKDAPFYRSYTNNPGKAASARRDRIANKIEDLSLGGGAQTAIALNNLGTIAVSNREHIRRYLDSQWGMSDPIEDNAQDGLAFLDFMDIDVRFPKATPNLGTIAALITPSPKETTMNQAIVITTKTFANGTDVSTMSVSDVYEMIAAQEASIAKLEAISAKPKKISAEIDARRAGIAALVAHLDNLPSV